MTEYQERHHPVPLIQARGAMIKKLKRHDARHVVPPEVVLEWRMAMSRKLGINVTDYKAAEILRMSRQGYRNLETYGASLRDAYAFEAILRDLKPFRHTKIKS
jgi:hypothetical protein